MKQITVLTICILVLLSCNNSTGQTFLKSNIAEVPIIDSAYIASKTKYFTIEDDRFKGEASNAIHQMITESQFIMLGESHGSYETSKLTATMLPLVKKAGFNNFAVEVGPYSAKKLMALSSPTDNTVKSMYNFNSKYYFKELDDTSIPFFHGVEDARFLEAAAKNDIELWGLDQEYFSSIIYQTDDLLNLAKDKPNFEAIQQMKLEADKVIRKLFIEDEASEKGIALFSEMLKEASVQQFFGQFDETDVVAMEMIEAIKISWDIYDRWQKGSHADRIRYMRENFMKNYEAKIKTGETPKILAKFGRLHAPKIRSGGCLDVGNLVHELALKNGTICSNVSLLNRYIQEEGVTNDNMNSKYYKDLKSILTHGKMNEWTFIDLKSIRADIKSGKIKLPKSDDDTLEKLIEGFDYQIILPLDKYVEPNYKL